jgi:signal peptidase I
MSTFRVMVQPIIAAVVLGFAVRSALIGLYEIPTASMQPTLQIGDRILVTRYLSQPPQRGDVVVFRSPHGDDLMVKRIVGVGGDFIDAHNGRLIIGGHTVAEPYLPGGTTTSSVIPQIVPSDSYFVLGDNRLASLDSRAWGVVPRNLLVGRARLVLWSAAAGGSEPHANATTAGPVRSTHVIRTERLFEPIR